MTLYWSWLGSDVGDVRSASKQSVKPLTRGFFIGESNFNPPQLNSSDNIFFVGYLVGYDGMPRVAKELSAIEVKRLTKPGMQAVGGVAGLYLQVTSPNARSWILRTRVADKRRDRFCSDKHKRQSSACLISAKAQSTAPCARCSNGSTILW